ncbi:HalOD1 output domain-containing protein [Natrinema versiforme]|uniref:Halobacterial output domain-containing protein n=1 Tax=Natrinema versiforme JCM 10478 TaxID=1227496 RepID=L9Y1L3_9EURY|nr:HalOD1 output domain-containing protein [Natrinema versiforme]ELY67930.1 hypothetical protein C489_07990 [Natrinema versiforme JCM 10478]
MDSQHSNRVADDAQTPVSIRVVEAVAKRDGIDPLEVSPPLHDAIDSTALDNLFAPTRSGTRDAGSVSFTYRGHGVRVESDGRIEFDSETERDSGVRSETESR